MKALKLEVNKHVSEEFRAGRLISDRQAVNREGRNRKLCRCKSEAVSYHILLFKLQHALQAVGAARPSLDVSHCVG